MTKKNPKQSNVPRRKRFRREQRLESAKSWLPTYEGKNVFRGYRKRYGVDWPISGSMDEFFVDRTPPAQKGPETVLAIGSLPPHRLGECLGLPAEIGDVAREVEWEEYYLSASIRTDSVAQGNDPLAGWIDQDRPGQPQGVAIRQRLVYVGVRIVTFVLGIQGQAGGIMMIHRYIGLYQCSFVG